MKLLVFILNKTEVLDVFLSRLAEEGIGGATILSSTGMARALSEIGGTGLSFFSSLRSIIDPPKEENKTILTVIKEGQEEIILRVIDEVVGDLSKPNTGIVFTIPLDMVKGLGTN